MGCSHATEIAMRIGSQSKEPRSRYCSFSFTNNSAGPSPTASFTIDPLQHHGPTANSNRPSIKPTTPSKTSSNSYKLHDLVEVFLFTNETVRIYKWDPRNGKVAMHLQRTDHPVVCAEQRAVHEGESPCAGINR